MVAVVASILLGVSFLLAGAAKVAAGPKWPAQAAALGAPAIAVPPLPFVAIIVGALLCAQAWRPLLGSVALAMLVAFSTLLVVQLRRGHRPPCACFGSWSAQPLSWRHLARNGVLMVLAVVAIAAS